MNRLRTTRWFAPASGAAGLLAAALLTAAMFPTFVSQGCPGCSAFYAVDLPQATLRDSPDAWAVVWIAGIIAATGVLFLAGVRSRLLATVNAVASLAALGLAFFEGVVAFPRVLAAAEEVPRVPIFFVLGPGYYLFLIGGAVAVGAAATVLLTRGDEDGNRAPRVLVNIGGDRLVWACLTSLALAAAGAFLPFVTLDCGFGCPPFAPVGSSFQGAIVGTPDGWIVMLLLAAAAIATGMRLRGRRPRVPSGTTGLLSLAAAALVSFDSLHGATRVLGWPYPIPTSPEVGYYLLQAGTALCVVLSVVLAMAGRPSDGLRRSVALTAPGRHPA